MKSQYFTNEKNPYHTLWEWDGEKMWYFNPSNVWQSSGCTLNAFNKNEILTKQKAKKFFPLAFEEPKDFQSAYFKQKALLKKQKNRIKKLENRIRVLEASIW